MRSTLMVKPTPNPMLAQMTWSELAQLVADIWGEMKRRNPIAINCYQRPFVWAVECLEEISAAEEINPTAEHGPGSESEASK